MKSQRYPYHKCRIVDDVFGEPHYLKEVLFDTKFKLEIYSGRPVANIHGRNKFILTSEIKTFILSTLDLLPGDFTDQLQISMVNKFRRTLLNNPFRSYEAWVKSKQADKPTTITFHDAKDNPQVLIDVLGQRYVLLSASMTEKGLALPKGVPEALFLAGNKILGGKHNILTTDIAKILEKTRFDPRKGVEELFPLSKSFVHSARRRLGYHLNNDKNVFFVQHIDELIHSTAKDFFLNHPETDFSQATIVTMKNSLTVVLKEVQNPKSLLIAALLVYWQQGGSNNRKKVDVVFGKCSRGICRAFLVLKKAKRI